MGENIEYNRINDIEEFVNLMQRPGTKCDDIVQTIYNILNKNIDIKVEENLEKIVKEYLGYYSYGIKYIHQKMHSCYEIISVNMLDEARWYLIGLEKTFNENN